MQTMMDGFGYGMMGFGMWIIWLIFFILLIIGLVLLVRYLWEGGPARKSEESALEILKKRYAGGEITKEEFEEKKKDLL